MQLFRTPHPCKRTTGSMGTGSIAGAMHTAPRHLRKSFAAPVTLPPTSGAGVITKIVSRSGSGSGSGSAVGTGAEVNVTPSRLIDTVDPVAQIVPVLNAAPIQILAPSEARTRARIQYSLAFPESDEEAIAVESLCTLVLRPFSQPVTVSPSRRLTTVQSANNAGREIAFELLGPAYVPPSTVLSVAILPDRLLIVLGSGVVEAYRYYTSDTAKTVLAITAGQPPQNRRVYTTQRRRNINDLARKQKALKVAQVKAAELVDSSLLERELADTPMISFEDEPVLKETKPFAGAILDGDIKNPDLCTGTEISTPDNNKNKNSALRGRLQTSSSTPIPHPIKQDSAEMKHGNDSKNPGSNGTNDEGKTPPKTPPKGAPSSNQRRLLSSKEPLVYVERDSSHFEVLPRLPLTKLLLRRDSCTTVLHPTGSSSTSTSTTTSKGFLESLDQHTSPIRADQSTPGFSGGRPLVRNPTQSTSLYALEQASSLIVFTRNGRLAMCGGLVDGSIAVREIDPRTGFVLSAADFHAHHHRVISIAVDSIAFARTDVVASCDAYGQTFVWTVSRLKAVTQQTGNSSYVISRRPQRLFRCQSSQHMRCEISWQLGLVVTVSRGVVHIFSVERDERLRAFEFDWEEETIDNLSAAIDDESYQNPGNDSEKTLLSFDNSNLGNFSTFSSSESSSTSDSQNILHLNSDGTIRREHVERVVNEINKNDYYSSDKQDTSGLSSTYKKRKTHKNAKIFSNCISRENDAKSENINKSRTAERKLEEEECSVAHRIAMCDDGIIILHVEVTGTDYKKQKESGMTDFGTASTTTSTSTSSCSSSHYILSYTLSGVRTGRTLMSSPVTFLSAPDRGSDIVISGQEDGMVTIFRF